MEVSNEEQIKYLNTETAGPSSRLKVYGLVDFLIPVKKAMLNPKNTKPFEVERKKLEDKKLCRVDGINSQRVTMAEAGQAGHCSSVMDTNFVDCSNQSVENRDLKERMLCSVDYCRDQRPSMPCSMGSHHCRVA